MFQRGINLIGLGLVYNSDYFELDFIKKYDEFVICR